MDYFICLLIYFLIDSYIDYFIDSLIYFYIVFYIDHYIKFGSLIYLHFGYPHFSWPFSEFLLQRCLTSKLKRVRKKNKNIPHSVVLKFLSRKTRFYFFRFFYFIFTNFWYLSFFYRFWTKYVRQYLLIYTRQNCFLPAKAELWLNCYCCIIFNVQVYTQK